MAKNIIKHMVESAKIGFRVFPLKENSKVPAIDHWVGNTTSDADFIEKSMNGFEFANYAIATGEFGNGAYKVGVIDIDDKSYQYGPSGYDRLKQWEEKYGELPETACAKTGRGGQHIFYLFRPDKLPKGFVNADIGIDFKSDGGYVVGSGSYHECGSQYLWDMHPDDYPIAKATKSVFDFIEWCRPLSGGSESSFSLPEEINSGCRNDTMFSYVCQMQSQGYTDDEISQKALEANRERCKPPLDHRTVCGMVHRVCSKYPKGEKRERVKSNGIKTLYGAYCSCVGKPYDGEEEEVKEVEASEHVTISVNANLSPLEKARMVIKQSRCCLLNGAPSVWNGTSYESGWFAIEKAIHGMFPTLKKSDRQEVLSFIELEIPERKPAPKRFIAFTNGVLDIETMDFVPPSANFTIPNVIPHKWNTKARDMSALNAIDKVSCGDDEIKTALLETAGLCMYRGREFSKCPILYGEGSNGKSTFLNILKTMTGRGNYSALEMQELSKQFSTALMAGKLANIGDDVSAEYFNSRSSSIYKKLVSGEEVKAEEKGKTPFFFRPYCTLIFSLNELPRIEDGSYGFYRRFQPIPFNYDSRTDPEKDINIEEKACKEESIEMLIVAAIKALRAAIERGELTIPSVTKDKVEEVRVDNNSVLAFIEDNEDEMDRYLDKSTSILYDDYKSWCSTSGYRAPYKRKGVTDIVCKEMGWTNRRVRVMDRRIYVFKKD